MQTQELRIIQLKRDSALVEEAFLLAERERELVDYEARESFAKAAERGQLWAAVGEGLAEGRLLGYVLTFISGAELLLSQVLVAPAERGQGIGTRLVDALCVWAGERGLPVVTLLPAPRAAEDSSHSGSHTGNYRLNDSATRERRRVGCWLRWGFSTPRNAEPLVTYTGRKFTLLQRDTAADLFGGGSSLGTASPEQIGAARLGAMLDPDLFEELAQCPALEAETELRVLASSRFRRELEVELGAESAEEMAKGHSRDPRGRTAAAREKRIHALAFFKRLAAGGVDLDAYRARATRILGEAEEKPLDLPVDELAIGAALGVPVFLTLNDALLQKEDALYRELGITVATPTGALLSLPVLYREQEYAPIRIHAESLRALLVAEELTPKLTDLFLAAEFGETQETLLRKLERFGEGVQPAACRRLLIGFQAGQGTAPGSERTETVPPLAESLQALAVLLRNQRDILRVPLWRIPAHPLRPTFARQILAGFMADALAEGRRMVLVQDGFMHGDLVEALRECGFLPAGADSWLRVLLPGGRRAKTWATELRELAELDPVSAPAVAQLHAYLAPKANGIPKEDFLALERFLAPGRVLGAELPSYLAQMKPGWAMRVFDAELAEYDLFEGTRRSVLRPREGVFFLPLGAGGGEGAQALPGRVLWQVCSRGGSGVVRAVSNLVGVEVGSAEALYKKYRRLGYFTDKDVQAMAGSGAGGSSKKAAAAAATLPPAPGEVCAWHFADTWMLPHPVPWAEAARILEETENRTQFGPIASLSQEGFQQLLQAGIDPPPVEVNNDLGLLWD